MNDLFEKIINHAIDYKTSDIILFRYGCRYILVRI